MEQQITDDKSITYRNMEVDELYHTKAGAIVEALEKHARALKVWEKDKERNDKLINNGYKIITLWENEININKNNLQNLIYL